MSKTTKTAAVKTAKAAKAAKAEAAAKSAAPRAKKEGLRVPQVRVLEAIAKSKKPLNRTEISEKASVTVGNAFNYLGSADKAVWPATEARVGYKGLVQLGYVKTQVLEIDGTNERVYTITPAGTKALAKAKADAK